MKLHDYLALPNSLTATELAARVNVSVTQLRQWVHGYAGRMPSPANCVAIERATNGVVARPDLRPDDWRGIWPELVKFEPNSTTALADQARVATEPVAQGVAHA